MKAQAVGAQQVHARAACDALEVGRQVGVNARRHDQRGLAFHATCDLQCGSHLGVGQRNDRQVSPRVSQVSKRAAGMDVNERHFAREPLSRHVVAQHFGLHMGIRLFGMFG